MSRLLRYGSGQLLEIEVADDAVLGDFTTPPGTPLDDTVAAVSAALHDPLGYPSLPRSTVPGDTAVVAIESGIPQLAALVAGAVHTLREGNVLPEDITVLLSHDASDCQIECSKRLLPDDIAAAVQVVRHDPRDAENLAYLAASKENKPIYFNRRMFDADVVLPIGCLRPSGSLGYLGIHGSLFPHFSDEASIERFRGPGAVQSPVQMRRHREEAEEAADLLGIHLMLQVVPGQGDQLLHALAGEATCLAEQGGLFTERAWRHQVERSPELAIVSIDGEREQQTWENFGRALHAALSVVADGGAIVLCTGLQTRPGSALQRLAGSADDDELHRELQRDRSPDAMVADLLLKARQRVRVYLISGLAEGVVEDLGIGYVSQPEQVTRLAKQHKSCVLVSSGHRAMLEFDRGNG